MGISERWWVVTIAASGVAFLTGCAECKVGDPDNCFQGSKRSCQDPDTVFSHAEWNVEACTGPNPYCALDGYMPTCVAVPDPVPECAGAAERSSICFQGTPAFCLGGYVQSEGACKAGACFASPENSCAYCDDGSHVPDPACASGVESICFEGKVVFCDCAARTTVYEDCVSRGLACLPASGDFSYGNSCAAPPSEGDAAPPSEPICVDGSAIDGASCSVCAEAGDCEE